MLDPDPPAAVPEPGSPPADDEARYLQVGPRLVDRDTHRVLGDAASPRLTPKAIAVLVDLARAAGRTRSRDELLDTAWRGTSPTPEVVSQIIKELRRALDEAGQPSLIETVPRAGYRLAAPVRWMARLPASTAASEDGGTALTAPAITAPAADATRLRRPAWTATSMLGVAVLVTAVLGAASRGMFDLREPTAPPAEPRAPSTLSDTPAVTMLTADKGREAYPRLSPDGGLVAYGAFDPSSGRDVIRMLSTGGGQRRIVAADPDRDLRYPAWSPDGSHLAYQAVDAGRCELRLQPALGGTAITVGACWPHVLQPFDFTPDGGIVAAGIRRAADPLGRMPYLQPGRPVEWWPGPPEGSEAATEPRVSPDGRWLAFRAGFAPQSRLMLRELPDGQARPIGTIRGDIRGLDWTADGRALVIGWVRDGSPSLYRVDRDSGVATPLGIADAQYPDVARGSDAVVFERLRISARLVSLPLPDAPAAAPVTPTPLTDVSTAVDVIGAHAPDGRRLAFVSNRSGSDQLWLGSGGGDEPVALTAFTAATIRGLGWSLDGRQLLLLVQQATVSRAWLLDVATATLRAISDDDSFIRSAAFGEAPGELWLVRQTADGWELLHMQADGRLQRQATPALGLREDPRRPLPWRMDPGFVVRPLDDSQPPISLLMLGGFDDWGVFDGQVWVAQSSAGELRLRRWDGQQFVDWIRVDGHFGLHGMRVMPHADGHAVLPQLIEDDSDIGMFQLSR